VLKCTIQEGYDAWHKLAQANKDKSLYLAGEYFNRYNQIDNAIRYYEADLAHNKEESPRFIPYSTYLSALNATQMSLPCTSASSKITRNCGARTTKKNAGAKR